MYTDDSGVIGAILQGDRDRYEELVQKYKRMVYGIAWSHLGDRDLSEDVAQETFVKAFSHLSTLRNPDRFPGWLAQIARNVCNTFGRRAKRDKAIAERWLLESDAAQAQEDDRRSLEERLRESFAALPAIHREALTVFYLEDKSLREATAVLGISETALKARLHRARIALRAQLEHRLEDTLDHLEPSKGFDRSVLGALPLMPNGVLGGGGIAAILGKSVASLGFVLWMVLAQVSVTSGLLWWFARSEAANIKDTPENRFRKVVLKRMVVQMGIVVIVSALASQLLTFNFGLRALCQVLALYMLIFLWPAWRFTRVNTTPGMWSFAFMVVAFLLSSAAIGFLNASVWLLAVALLTTNVVAFLASRNRPARQDYNLFLRAATGGLGEAPDCEHPLPNRLTQTQLRAFARFLGNQWLVVDYFTDGSAIRLMLPGMRLPILAMLGLSSSVTISADGSCTAHVTPGDLKAIRQMTGWAAGAEDLQATVGRVVRYALICFVAGNLDAARSALTAQDDEAIFKQNTGWTRGFIVLFVLALAAVAMILVLQSLGDSPR